MKLNNYVTIFLILIVLLSLSVSATTYPTYLIFEITEFDAFNSEYDSGNGCSRIFPIGLNESLVPESGLPNNPITLKIYDSIGSSEPIYTENYYTKEANTDDDEFYNVVWHASAPDPNGFTNFCYDSSSYCNFFEYELGEINLDTDEEETYTLCGVLESEPENGLISIHSPIAKALIGKRVDDDFKINLPKGKKEYEILEIEYKNIFTLKKNIRTKEDFAFH